MSYNAVELEAFKADMGSEIRMKELGRTTYYLGIHFQHEPERKTVHLHQELYIQQLLGKFGLHETKVACSPLEENHSLIVESPLGEGE